MNILLIRLRLIGDVVFTTPAIRALKRAFPDARLTYLVEEAAAPVVAGNPHLDDVIVAGRTRGLARIADDIALGWRLRRCRFDVAVDLHGGPRSSWLSLATGARQRIGYDIHGRSWMYTRTVSRPRELRPRHSVVNQWDLLEAIEGWPGQMPDPLQDAVEMLVDPAADARIAQRLDQAGIRTDDEVVVIHVSAGNPFRRWPEPAFARVVEGLAASGAKRRIILSSGPSDRHAAARITAAARDALGPDRARRVVDFGDFNLSELRALIGRSRLFVGGDTGPLHIAATTATPVVGIYGPTLPARSAPWRDGRIPTESVEVTGLPCRPCDQRVCEPGDFRCLTTLMPDDVTKAAERVLRLSA
ncbi:MAG: glycosyltransferase family 9 protein [Acidobacteria bacterium]|nr:glycosyltransferase family 9 protein [Acidobacteriota bacterium]MCA1648835.1 glycosyltransferase family 9 protein [Acidobacteriota bacterium]